MTNPTASDSDRLRAAIHKTPCTKCAGTGDTLCVVAGRNAITGQRCTSCRGSGRSSVRAFAAAKILTAGKPLSLRSLQRFIGGKKPLPAGVIAWIETQEQKS